VTARYKASV